MGVGFNPFLNSGFDSKGSSSPTAGRYSNTFLTTDWVGPSLGHYNIVITSSTHGKGLNPEIEVYELVGSDYEKVEIASKTNGSGDITLDISSSPDGRFNGKYIIF